MYLSCLSSIVETSDLWEGGNGFYFILKGNEGVIVHHPHRHCSKWADQSNDNRIRKTSKWKQLNYWNKPSQCANQLLIIPRRKITDQTKTNLFFLPDLFLPSYGIQIMVNTCMTWNCTWAPPQVVITSGKLRDNFDTRVPELGDQNLSTWRRRWQIRWRTIRNSVFLTVHQVLPVSSRTSFKSVTYAHLPRCRPMPFIVQSMTNGL